MAFRSNPVLIGTTDTDVYEAPGTNEGAVVLAIGNKTVSPSTWTLSFFKQTTAQTTEIAIDVAIAANTIVKFPAPISVQAGDKIIMSAGDADTVTALPTITIGGAAEVITLINPLGEWSSVANYVKGDAVSLDGNSYIATGSNTNSEPLPDGTNTDWMVLALQGASGGGDVTGPEGGVVSGELAVFADTTGKVIGGGGVSPGDIVGLDVGGGLESSGGALRREALTGDVTASAGSNATTIANSVVTAAKLAERSVNEQTASYTLVLADANKIVAMNVASANDLTVPPNSSEAFPTNTQIDIIQEGAGQTTVVAGSGVTINSDSGKLKIGARYTGATLVKRGSDTWVLLGNLAT